MTGPCTWPISYLGCSDVAPLESLDPEERVSVERMAVEYLWNWTRQAFGTCEVTVRPCPRRALYGTTFWGGTRRELVDFGVSAISNGCECISGCGCPAPFASVRLVGPVERIVSVVIDGVTLDPSTYELQGSVLRRLDDVWPATQDMQADPGEVDTWTVTYLLGTPVPEGGQIAAGVLARELALALCRSNKCQLPERMRTITREGVTVTLMDPFDGLENGMTGIWLIDAWVNSITRPPRKSSVMSPDFRRSRHRSA